MFTTSGDAVGLAVGKTVGVGTWVGWMGVDVSCGTGGVKVGGGVGVVATRLGRLQPTNMTSNILNDMSVTVFWKKVYGWLVFIME
jgi:hypothetical protein